jgi:HAD superfamily hydrolase (TIGR01509 family)
MTPKLVIFDCDGVLIDSEPVTDRVLTANLARHGLTIPMAEAHTLFAGGTMKGAGEEAVRRGATLPDNWLDEIYAEQSAALAQGVPVFEGVHALLDQLDARGVATAVASNGPMFKMEITLTPSGLWDRLAGRIYSGHDYVPKPDPAMLLHACKVANVAISEAVMIDDTPAGCSSALNAKMRCFGFVPQGDTSAVQGVGAEPVRSMSQIAAKIGVT